MPEFHESPSRPQLRSPGIGSRIRSDLGDNPTRLDLRFDDVCLVGEEASRRGRLQYDHDISRAGLRDRVPIGVAEECAMTNAAVRVGAVAAGPSGTTIWEGIRAYFAEAGVPIEPVLFSSYEEQTEALFNRTIDIAWNGPVAYVRCAARSADCRVLAMRDVDVDFTTVMIARRDSGIGALDDLRGKRLALGDGGSRWGAILPLYYLRQAGLDSARDVVLRS